MAMYFTLIRPHVRVLCALIVLCVRSLSSTTMNNVFDTQPIHTPHCSDVFFNEKGKGEIRFHISPFYQQTSTARNGEGAKVAGGNRLGQWNMYGIFFGPAANPTGNANLVAAYPNPKALGPAKTAIAAATNQLIAAAQSHYHANADLTDEAVFRAGIFQQNNFITTNKYAYFDVPVSYEKIGCRSQLNFDFGFGLGVAVKAGVVDVKYKTRGFVLEPQFAFDAGFPGASGSASSDQADGVAIYKALFEPTQMDKVLSDVSLSAKPFHKATAEDVHISCYWNIPLEFSDSKGEPSVTVIPRLAVGAWLPTGDEIDQTKLFSVPTGNNGFYAGTIEASLGFDFPVFPKGKTLQFNVGGGALICPEKDKNDQRIHSSILQQGIIPWRTNVTWKPGVTWHANASMMASGFVDDMSVFLDFIYTQHLQDTITLKTTNAAQKAAFAAGVAQDERDSSWKNQQINGGFTYKVAESLSFGGALQAHISGVRVMRSVTLLGGMTFAF